MGEADRITLIWLGLRCVKMSRDLVLIELQASAMWCSTQRAVLPYMANSICFGNIKNKTKTVDVIAVRTPQELQKRVRTSECYLET